MTFAQGVLRLVGIGSQTAGSSVADLPDEADEADETVETGLVTGDAAIEPWLDEPAPAPGLRDIEAAVALVQAGLAERVHIAGVRSWPGLLWEVQAMARDANLVILPIVARLDGRVEIVVQREDAPAEPTDLRG